ncbi:MAG: hypothetical protein AB7V46_16715 [Thermomicrobiales bacterium]
MPTIGSGANPADVAVAGVTEIALFVRGAIADALRSLIAPRIQLLAEPGASGPCAKERRDPGADI